MIHREGLTYSEGHPRLNLITWAAAKKHNRILCRFLDEADNEIGQAFLYERDNGQRYIFHDLPAQWPKSRVGVAPVETILADAKTSSGVLREFFKCPSCEKRVAVLVYKMTWRCSRCHGLLSRSQVVSEDIREHERLADLVARIKLGRPTGMRHVTYAKLKADCMKLRRALKNRPPMTASISHVRQIRAVWTTLEGIDVLFNSDFAICGEEIVLRPQPAEPDEIPQQVIVEENAISKPKPFRFDPKSIEFEPDYDSN